MESSPLLDHVHGEPTLFTPSKLIAAVVASRALAHHRVPDVVILEVDGDLHDALVAEGAPRCESWACFHSPMCVVEVDGAPCGVVPRTIGGPYATLVAEQLFASGAKAVLALTSAGRVRRGTPLPHLVVADSAIRDEGTSLHYLAMGRIVRAPSSLVHALRTELERLPIATTSGLVWTTDAPYRETRTMLEARAGEGALAVEMQAASLFALAQAKGVQVGVVAYVTNAVDAESEPFDKGPPDIERRVLTAMCRAALAVIQSRAPHGSEAPAP